MYEGVEVGGSTLKLTTQQKGHTATVIDARLLGTQRDGLLEVAQRILVVAQTGTSNGAILIGHSVDGVDVDGPREVGVGTQQVFEVVLGDSAQKVALVGLAIDIEQHVQRTDSLAITALDDVFATHPKEVGFVVLGAHITERQHDKCHRKKPYFE